MDLIKPDFGLLIWTGLTFLLLLFILTKFAWKPILNMVDKREQAITESLELAKKTKAEMLELQSKNEELLKEAKAERDNIIKDAREVSQKMVAEAKDKAKKEAEKMLADAHSAIQTEKNAALAEMKAKISDLAIEVAEKVVKSSVSTDGKQKELATKYAEELNLN